MNPLQVRMQDEGAAIQGLGHTLMEQYVFDEEGRIRNLGAIDYRIPTSMDLPREMVSEIVENADGPGPYGAKGMSEGALLCVAAAVGRRGGRGERRGHPRPAPDAGARLAGHPRCAQPGHGAGTDDSVAWRSWTLRMPSLRLRRECGHEQARRGRPHRRHAR